MSSSPGADGNVAPKLSAKPGGRERGYILYPGKLTQVETFRVGCIGAIDSNEINVVSAVAETLRDMGIQQVSPAAARRVA